MFASDPACFDFLYCFLLLVTVSNMPRTPNSTDCWHRMACKFSPQKRINKCPHVHCKKNNNRAYFDLIKNCNLSPFAKCWKPPGWQFTNAWLQSVCISAYWQLWFKLFNWVLVLEKQLKCLKLFSQSKRSTKATNTVRTIQLSPIFCLHLFQIFP